jgi:hypothetical protein
MKPGRPTDFRIHVQRQVDEEDPSVSHFYAGIYLVAVNDIDIHFFPEVDRAEWPPPLPEDIDCPTSVAEARRWTLAKSPYSLVLDEQRAGGEERLSLFPFVGDPPHEGWCFLIGAAEHAQLDPQLARLASELPSVHDSIPFSTLRGSPLHRALSRIIDSPHLSDDDRRILSRA